MESRRIINPSLIEAGFHLDLHRRHPGGGGAGLRVISALRLTFKLLSGWRSLGLVERTTARLGDAGGAGNRNVSLAGDFQRTVVFPTCRPGWTFAHSLSAAWPRTSVVAGFFNHRGSGGDFLALPGFGECTPRQDLWLGARVGSRPSAEFDGCLSGDFPRHWWPLRQCSSL